ncbi:MAG: electron transfer flavoprotein [Planctomycetes bacterium]|nr:electron transfer flavoprotein [Planctomycetota bacterium]
MQDYTKVSVLIVGGGPAGLSAGITVKRRNPNADVCVIDKAAAAGNHNLSGAVLESESLAKLLDPIDPQWRSSDEAKAVLLGTVEKDNMMFFCGRKWAFNILPLLKMARGLKLAFGQMMHEGDCICSVSKLTAWLSKIASAEGVEVMHGFAAENILWDEGTGRATGVKLVDQGLNKERQKERNYLAGEIISADVVILAEGCDGLLSEKFIQRAGLSREGHQLYSLGVKELIRVSDAQYQAFTEGRVVHAMGWPIWRPLIGPSMFGGGIMYPMATNHIAVGMIVGLDYKYCDFNPQDALTLFKEHAWVKPFIDGGQVTEAGAKMIPEGGLYAVPRCPATGTIGRGNVVLIGDSAGFVNMLKIKGLHNAIESGIAAGTAAADNLDSPLAVAQCYSRLLKDTRVLKELETAKNFRQTVARFGPLQGIPLSIFGGWLPKFNIEPDYQTMTPQRYRLKPPVRFDKDTFTAMAATVHREDQPCHLLIGDPAVCAEQCLPKFGAPCITFCPAGVYETIHGQPKPANPSNCLHCKTCQRKCPFDNIRWTVPEPTGGPRYKTM